MKPDPCGKPKHVGADLSRPRTIADAIRARLADAVDALSEIDALVEADADRLPPLLLARALIRLARIGRRLAQLRQSLANALDDGRQAVATGSTRQNTT
jgi:hypothetical protein